MTKPSIFIASSGGGRTLAKQLQLKLQLSRMFDDVCLWFEDSDQNPGTTITQRLKRRADKSDFVAVLLTHDDVVFKKGDELRVPRDNCLFEAGLFTGALGVDFRRCFLISGVPQRNLPTDLQELQYIPFNEPGSDEDLRNSKACQDAIKDVVPIIESQVEMLGTLDRLKVALITKEDLIEMERTGQGGNLTWGAVVVNATQPLEVKYRFALRTLKNMEKEVDYCYFFHGSETGIFRISRMIQMFSLAGLIEGNNDDPPPADRRIAMIARKADVSKNLDTIQEHLRIYFLRREAPLEFCVHNADSDEDAKCYLRYSKDEFVPWHADEARKAKAVAQDLLRQRPEKQPSRIFCSTLNFDLDTDECRSFKDNLSKEIEKVFIPELHNKVKSICFGK